MLAAEYHKKTKGELLAILDQAFEDQNKTAERFVELQNELKSEKQTLGKVREDLRVLCKDKADLESDLSECQEGLRVASVELADTKKRLEESSRQSDSWYRQLNEKKAELESVHGLLDAFPNSPARKSNHEESYNRVEYTVPVRIAAWLASFINPTIQLKDKP